VNTSCTAEFNVKKFYVLPTQFIYVLYVDLRTNTVNSINCTVFITKTECVYCAVRAKLLNKLRLINVFM